MLTVGFAFSVHAGKADCKNIDGDGAKPIKEVGKEDAGKQNDYDEVVEEDDRKGVTYLSFIGGNQPKPNDSGLSPKNPEAEWTGWGGPIDTDNATIGEGAGTRNHIVIGGIYFERGIGAHSVATVVYDLTGDNYLKFEGHVGMSDEKTPPNVITVAAVISSLVSMENRFLNLIHFKAQMVGNRLKLSK